MASQNVSQIMLDYQEQAMLLFSSEDNGGGAWYIEKKSTWEIADWYGRVVMSRQPVMRSYIVDNASRTIFFVWNSGGSSNRIAAEMLRFDSQGKIRYQVGSMNCLGTGANDSHAANGDVGTEADLFPSLMTQLYYSWRIGDVDGVLQLHAESSQVLYYNPAVGDDIQTFSGLEQIRQFFDEEVRRNHTLDSRFPLLFRGTSTVDFKVTEAGFWNPWTRDADLFVILIPNEGGESIAHLFVTRASDDGISRSCVYPLV
jgi:hypothetical protein